MRTSTTITLQLNKVYLPEFLFLAQYESEHQRSLFRDVTSFEFIVEAIVAYSASEIVVQSYRKKIDDRLLDNVPRILRKRIKFIRADIGVLKLATTILSPVFEEHHIGIIEPNGYSVRGTGEQLDEELSRDVFSSWHMLYEFLLGLKYKLEVDIDIERFRKAVSTIRQKSKNPESRANMSILEGILNCYNLGEVECLRIVPHAVKEQKESFISFLEDVDYEELSKANFGLGIPLHFKKYSIRIRHLVRRIVSNDRFPHIFEACSKPLMIATQVPIPSSDLVKTMMPSSYIPPIVNLEPALHQARKAWIQSVGDETIAERHKLHEDIFKLH